MTARTRNFVIPNGYFNTSKGVHEYAIVAPTEAEVTRKSNEFYLKVYNVGGRVLDEQRQRLPQGSIHIVFTYKI